MVLGGDFTLCQINVLHWQGICSPHCYTHAHSLPVVDACWFYCICLFVFTGSGQFSYACNVLSSRQQPQFHDSPALAGHVVRGNGRHSECMSRARNHSGRQLNHYFWYTRDSFITACIFKQSRYGFWVSVHFVRFLWILFLSPSLHLLRLIVVITSVVSPWRLLVFTIREYLWDQSIPDFFFLSVVFFAIF